jgi:arylsulfatase
MDPFERAETDSNNYNVWWEEIAQIIGTASQDVVGRMVMSFKDFPPRQAPSSFSVDQVMDGMRRAGAGNK